MEVLKKLYAYLTFKKPDPDAPTSGYLTIMHGINKISIFMFLIAIIIWIFKVAM
ncbi:MAG: DUF6728 family protein [Bacteroidia bacterium]|nr:DUF6728 family protein [Bacteroidia bacterium]